MKRLLLFALVVLFSVTTLSAQNANTRYRGSAKPGDIVYSNAYDGFVNMRQTASYKAAKVGEFKNGTGAVMLENLGEWMKIEVSGIVGYVPSRFVQDRPTHAYTGSATVDQIVNVGLLNVFDNGYWERGYNFAYERGYYILQRNEIKFVVVCRLRHDTPELVWEYVSPKEEGAITIIPLSEYFKEGYGDKSLLDGVMPEEGDDYPFCHTMAQFKQLGKEVAKCVQQLKR